MSPIPSPPEEPTTDGHPNDERPSNTWDRREEIIGRFEQAWSAEAPPRILDFLPTAGPDRRHLLVELLHIDVERRFKASLTTPLESYAQQFPELAQDRELRLGLIRFEYELRRRLDPAASWDEYLQRFPAWRDDLIALARNANIEGSATPALRETLAWQGPTVAGPTPAGLFPEVPGYEVLDVLGKGGMGIVYKARQKGLQRLVALKMIRDASLAGPGELARFQTEAQALATLQHPHIVQVFEVGQINDLPFFSLEYVEGANLGKRLARTPQPPHWAAEMLETLARATQAAHQKNIIHRDLKPANVLLTLDGTPKITDFGLAKKLDAEEMGQTHAGAVMGTPNYMAPEQAAGKVGAIGAPSDVYALGVMLYEMLTGRLPLVGATMMETLLLVMEADPVPPRQLQPKVPRDLETICLKCLRKYPQQRYASAQELADDVHRFRVGDPIHAQPIGPLGRAMKFARRRPALVGLVLASCIALVAVFGGTLLAVLYRNQVLQQQLNDLERVNEARQLVDRARAHRDRGDWEKAHEVLQTAISKIADQPFLHDLRPEVEALLKAAESHLAASDRYRAFAREHEDALFYAMLSANEGGRASRQELRVKADQALQRVGLSLELAAPPVLDPAYTAEAKAQITARSYELFLIVADAVEDALPGRADAERHDQAREALALLARAQHLGLQTQAYHLCRARYLSHGGQETDAQAERLLAAARKPVSALDYYLVGKELYRQNDPRAAIQAFDQTLELERSHFWAQYFLAVCYVRLDRSDLARVYLDNCLKERPDIVWIYLLRGFARGQLQQYGAAALDFQKALQLRPSTDATYALYNNRAVVYVGQQRYAEAIADLELAITLKPRQYQAYVSLAKTHQQQRQLTEAIRQFDRGITAAEALLRARELDPATLALLFRNRARLHLEVQDRLPALHDFDRAIELDTPGSLSLARSHGERGRILQADGQLAEALAAYDRAIALNTDHLDIYQWRAEVLLQLQRPQEAIDSVNAYLKKGGKPTAEVYRERGLARGKLKDHLQAIDDYTRSLELKPDDAFLHVERGYRYLDSLAYRLGEQDFDRAIALDPENGAAYLGRGFARVRLGQTAAAAADVEKALAQGPCTVTLLHQSARINALAVGKLDRGEVAREPRLLKQLTRGQDRAVELLGQALELLPAEQRNPFWIDKVQKDSAFEPIRRVTGYGNLDRRYGMK